MCLLSWHHLTKTDSFDLIAFRRRRKILFNAYARNSFTVANADIPKELDLELSKDHSNDLLLSAFKFRVFGEISLIESVVSHFDFFAYNQRFL